MYCVRKGLAPIPWNELGPVDIEAKSPKKVEKILDNEVGRKWQEVWDRETDDGDWIKKLVPRVSNEYVELVERPNCFLS